MNWIKKLSLAFSFFVLLSACTSDAPVKASDEGEKQPLIENENEALENKPSSDSINPQDSVEEGIEIAEEPEPPEAQPATPIREGQHSFTLQWISWEKPGVVDITSQGNQKYKITGQQESDENDDYLRIDGELTVLDEKTLLFAGELVSKVSYLNGGEPCARQTPVHFKITGSRKYWRLQEKDNCEDGNTVDYIDIYF